MRKRPLDAQTYPTEYSDYGASGIKRERKELPDLPPSLYVAGATEAAEFKLPAFVPQGIEEAGESKESKDVATSPQWFCNLADGSCSLGSGGGGGHGGAGFPTAEACQSSCRFDALIDAYKSCRMPSFEHQLASLLGVADGTEGKVVRQIRAKLLPNLFHQLAGACPLQAATIDSVLNQLYPTGAAAVAAAEATAVAALLNTFLLDLSEGKVPSTISRQQVASIFRQLVDRFYNLKGTVDFAQTLRDSSVGMAGFKRLLPLLIYRGTKGTHDAVDLLYLFRYWPVPFRYLLDEILSGAVGTVGAIDLKALLRGLSQEIKNETPERIIGPLAIRMGENRVANLRWLTRTISKL